MAITLILSQSLVEYLRDPFLDLCCLNLKIDGVNIQEVSTVKYLGVTFDSNLTWKNHVNELCLKLSKTVGIFSKLRYYVNVDSGALAREARLRSTMGK